MSTSYLIVGDGRVARHIRHYFQLEGLAYQSWRRQDGPEQLKTRAQLSSHALILINDHAIDDFVNEHRFLERLVTVHFSGAMISEVLPSAHPLMCFADELYDLETYRNIPFVLEESRVLAEKLLPGLKNPFFYIPSHQKPLYHAGCVMSGNFTVLLWEKVFSLFEEQLGLPKQVMLPYLQRTAFNLSLSDKQSVLTGPLLRGDTATLDRHLSELKDDPYQKVYRAFIDAYNATPSAGLPASASAPVHKQDSTRSTHESEELQS